MNAQAISIYNQLPFSAKLSVWCTCIYTGNVCVITYRRVDPNGVFVLVGLEYEIGRMFLWP